MFIAETPALLKNLYSELVWSIDTEQKEVFLTFDDGPTEQHTYWILEQLRAFDARATFFCVGKNVEQYPEQYKAILADGHQVGNHTYDHLKGWDANDMTYMRSVLKCDQLVDSDLFRPPYGRIKKSQIRRLKGRYRIIMWDVLSGDYSPKLSGEKCLENVVQSVKKGSIIVFHDSIKASANLYQTLPGVLEYFAAEGYRFNAIA